jgi:hypothetical protein
VNIELDIERSTATFAGRTFDACALIVPDIEGSGDDDWNRMLGDPVSKRKDFYIPSENGVLIQVGQANFSDHPVRVELIMVSPVTDWNNFLGDQGARLPIMMGVEGDTISELRAFPYPVTWQWLSDDLEWCAWFIDRLSRLKVIQPQRTPEHRVTMVRLGDAPKKDGEGS